jgi:murein DD-endopeptidase MepM/ murein hydrolase activator NlpD
MTSAAPSTARAAALILLVILAVPLAPVSAIAGEGDLSARGWIWPLERFRVARPFVAPAHEYGPGHRGVDLEPLDTGAAVLVSPSDGVVAFAGDVAGRGIITIDHGGGLVTTLEPVETTLSPGTVVARGDDVATLSVGGHASPGTIHFGVRLDGGYINPLLLLGGVPRAVLLPCCE